MSAPIPIYRRSKLTGCATEGEWEEWIFSKLITIRLLVFVMDCSLKRLQWFYFPITWFYFPITIQGKYQICRYVNKPILKSLMKNIQIY